MSISGVSNSSTTQAAWQAMIQQQKQTFSQLSSALQNGDLAGAQQAFASLQNSSGQGQTSNANTTSSTNSSNSSSGNAITNDFQALSTALQSGNIKDAQSAFAQLQTDMKAKKGGHHHHHHGGAGSSNTSTAGATSTNTTTTSSTTSVASLLENSTMSVSA